MDEQAGQKERFTVQEAAAHIKVSATAIRNATLENRLPFHWEFGRKLIKAEDLKAYQERTQAEGKPKTGRPKKQAQEGQP